MKEMKESKKEKLSQYKKHNIKLYGRLIAQSPISHNGDINTGITVTLRRINMITSNGQRMPIPYIDGNAIRGLLRRYIMRDLLDRLDQKILSPRTYHMLFSGGNLEQVARGNGELDIDLRKKIALNIPPLSVFGTSYLNQSVPGKLIVSKCFPVCKELQHLFEHYRFQADDQSQVYEALQLTDESFQTRHDDRKTSEIENQTPIQMKINTEVFIPGTQFMHYFQLLQCDEVEASMFHHLIQLWMRSPIIGGKSSIGNGQIRIIYPKLVQLPSPEIYLKFITDHKANILETLEYFDQNAKKKTQKSKKRTKAQTKAQTKASSKTNSETENNNN